MCFVFQIFFVSLLRPLRGGCYFSYTGLFRASHDHSMEGAPGKPHGLVMVLGFACGSFASVGREASQEAGQACFWCPEAESNHRHEDFQSSALPTELSGLIYNYFTYFKLNFNICQIFISFLCILSFIKFCYKL